LSDNKRYFWFKLSDDFFKDRRIKRLRRLAGGDTYTIIYQKMLLLTLKTKGIYEIDDYEDLAESLSLDIDEDVDNIKVTLEFLKSSGLIIENLDKSILLTEVQNLTGSECSSARRMRKLRESKKGASHCDTNVTQALQNSDDRVRERDRVRDRDRDRVRDRDQRESIEDNNSLSQEQYDSLIKEYGKTLVDEKIANASNYKNCMKYEKIREWCEVDKNKTPKKSTNKFNNFKQREYSREEIEEIEKAFFI